MPKKNQSHNEDLYDKALAAIKELFNDRSVSQSEARQNLGGLKDEIDTMMDSLGR